jgi:hypothetical protein
MQKLYIIVVMLLTVVGCNDKPEGVAPSNSIIYGYPNPAKDQIFLAIRNMSNQDYQLKVFGTHGNTILEEAISPGAEWQSVSIPLDDDEGYVHVILVTEKETIIRKILTL